MIKGNVDISQSPSLKDYLAFDRIDIIYGRVHKPSIFPCEKCDSEDCDGEGECKGFGSYQLGISMGGI